MLNLQAAPFTLMSNLQQGHLRTINLKISLMEVMVYEIEADFIEIGYFITLFDIKMLFFDYILYSYLMNLDKITDKSLAIVGTIAAVIAVYFLVPKVIAIPSALIVLIIAGAIVVLKNRWVESEAD